MADMISLGFFRLALAFFEAKPLFNLAMGFVAQIQFQPQFP